MIKKYIPFEEMVNNHVYIISARNARVGIWSDKIGGFIISRFCGITGDNYLFSELHWDHPDKGTAKPFEYLARHIPKEDESTLSYLNFINRFQEEKIEKALKIK